MGRAGVEEDDVGSRRFFAANLLSEPGTLLSLGEEAARHARVLRLAAADAVELFDGAGRSCRAVVHQLARDVFVCRVEEVRSHEPPPKVVLVACLPKVNKLDDVVRMTTELGVTEIRLALSERSVPRTDAERLWAKRERLSKIALEAARQSENAWLPRLYPPQPLSEILAEAPSHALKLALIERSLASFELAARSDEVWVIVGPEGGLSPADRTLLERFECVKAGLGRAILRSETACVVGVALVLDRMRRQH